MDWRKLGKALLFPHKAVFLLVYGMVCLEETDPVCIVAYVLSAYTLAICCARIPRLVHSFRSFQSENKYIKRWSDDVRLRIHVTQTGNALWNGAYGALQLGLGVYHQSFWFYSMAGYYFSLAIMRGFLLRHIMRCEPGEKRGEELRRCRICGWVLLILNLALSGMMLAMPVGIAAGFAGLGILACAYPVYQRTLRREREKIAPEILRLTDELIK